MPSEESQATDGPSDRRPTEMGSRSVPVEYGGGRVASKAPAKLGRAALWPMLWSLGESDPRGVLQNPNILLKGRQPSLALLACWQLALHSQHANNEFTSA